MNTPQLSLLPDPIDQAFFFFHAKQMVDHG